MAKRRGELKLKAPQHLQDVLTIAKALIAKHKVSSSAGAGSDGESGAETDHGEPLDKLKLLVHVLERGGPFRGINRKVQLKPLKWEVRDVSRAPSPVRRDSNTSLPTVIDPRVDVNAVNPSLAGTPDINLTALTAALATQTPVRTLPPAAQLPLPPAASTATLRQALMQAGEQHVVTANDAQDPEGSSSDEETSRVVVSAQLVLKWGGVLTEAGRQQAFDLGTRFRQSMYPGE